MKKPAYGILIALVLSIHALAFAQNRAVRIDAVSDGRGIDSAALQTARQIIGRAVADGTVDTFVVYSPRVGGPIPIEGGLFACAEAGFNSDPVALDRFFAQLRAIRPLPGTFFNFELTTGCTQEPEPAVCGGFAGIPCPDDEICVDDPRDGCDPTNGGVDCSGICEANTASTP